MAMSRDIKVRFWFKFPLYYLHALGPLTNHLTSLSLSFLTCRLGLCVHALQGTYEDEVKGSTQLGGM